MHDLIINYYFCVSVGTNISIYKVFLRLQIHRSSAGIFKLLTRTLGSVQFDVFVMTLQALEEHEPEAMAAEHVPHGSVIIDPRLDTSDLFRTS